MLIPFSLVLLYSPPPPRFINACSLRHKVDALASMMVERKLDVLGIAETWLDCTISDGEIRRPGYTCSIARSDRAGRRGGETCFYYRQHLPIVHAAGINSEGVESTWLELRGRQGRHLLACAYTTDHQMPQSLSGPSLREVKAKIKISPVVVFGVLSRMVLVRGS